jgi:hypothetical protein
MGPVRDDGPDLRVHPVVTLILFWVKPRDDGGLELRGV